MSTPSYAHTSSAESDSEPILGQTTSTDTPQDDEKSSDMEGIPQTRLDAITMVEAQEGASARLGVVLSDTMDASHPQPILISRLFPRSGRGPTVRDSGKSVPAPMTVSDPSHAPPWLRGTSRRGMAWAEPPVPRSKPDTEGRWLTLPTMADKTAEIPIDAEHSQEAVVSRILTGPDFEQEVTGPVSLIDVYERLWKRAVEYGEIARSRLILDATAGTFVFLDDWNIISRSVSQGQALDWRALMT